MAIEFSASEYRDLLDILHIADVILSGHRREPDQRTERHRALIQRIYGRAQSEGLERLISYDAHQNVYAPTSEFEENTPAHAVIEEFRDHLFWDELISRLSVRDAAQTAGGMDRLNEMSDSERRATEGPIRQRYLQEFSRNGIAHLALIEHFDNGGKEPVRTSD